MRVSSYCNIKLRAYLCEFGIASGQRFRALINMTLSYQRL
jgi:hypothetical protein